MTISSLFESIGQSDPMSFRGIGIEPEDFQIVEVYISAAQFADMITSMNMGEGVPCTIKSVEGRRLEDPPDLETEAEKVQVDFKGGLQDLVGELVQAQQEIETILEKKSVNKADRAAIQAKFNRVLMQVRSNVPFVLESFQEATEKVVTQAKAEVEAFTTTRIMAAGIKAIQGQQLQEDEPRLESPRLESLKPNGLMCAECGEPQYNTPSGPVCKNGHGGEPGVAPRK